VCEKAFNRSIGAFVQAFGSDQLDASTLLIPAVGFLPPADARVRGTIEAVERGLMPNGFVLRYDTVATKDGLLPQAFSHIALVNTAHNIARPEKPCEQRSGHLSLPGSAA
jgi:hypothetical protein